VTLIGERNLEDARALLERELKTDTPIETLSQRRLWSARVLLALADQDAALALELTEKLIAVASPEASTQVIPLLWYMKARALTQLGQLEHAQEIARAGLERALVENLRPYVWRFHVVLSAVSERQGDHARAEALYRTARTNLLELALEIPEEQRGADGKSYRLRDTFTERALARAELLHENL
jgi:tetratricopeptide (TPR) repeat protein